LRVRDLNPRPLGYENEDGILKDAVSDNYLRHSPMEGVKKPKISKTQKGKALKPDQIQAILDGCKTVIDNPDESLRVRRSTEQMRLLFLTALLTGVRRGELLGLHWSDIDWDKDVIHVQRALYFRRGKHFDEGPGFVFVEPKSEKSRRDIDLSPTLKKELRELHMKKGKPKKGLVFCTAKGGPLDPDNVIKRNFPKLLKKAGLGEWVEIEKNEKKIRRFRPAYRWHDLRHTFGSLKIEQGASIYYAQRQIDPSHRGRLWPLAEDTEARRSCPDRSPGFRWHLVRNVGPLDLIPSR
jgi:integrase